MKRDIHQQWFFEQGPEIVWDYLTKPELMAQWLMENDFCPVVGHRFQFRSTPNADCKQDGIAYCEVLEIIPFKKLSYTWNAGPGNGEITLQSVVIWTLRQSAGGTELHLHHTGFTDMDSYTSHIEGWTAIGKRFMETLKFVKNGTTQS